MSRFCQSSMDFEQWSRLAVQDPEGFEAMRRELIDKLIESASERCRRRLRGLQWRVDQVRQQAPSPMAACVSLSSMMWDSFAGEDGLAETLNRQGSAKRLKLEQARVIPLKKGH